MAASCGVITTSGLSAVACKEKGHNYNFLVDFNNEKMLAGQNIATQKYNFAWAIAKNMEKTVSPTTPTLFRDLEESIEISLLTPSTALIPGAQDFSAGGIFIPIRGQSKTSKKQVINSLSFDIKFLDIHITKVENYFKKYFEIKNKSWQGELAGKLSFNQNYYVNKSITNLTPESANDLTLANMEYQSILQYGKPTFSKLTNALMSEFKKEGYHVNDQTFKYVSIYEHTEAGDILINTSNFSSCFNSKPTANFYLKFKEGWQEGIPSPSTRPDITKTYKYFQIQDVSTTT